MTRIFDVLTELEVQSNLKITRYNGGWTKKITGIDETKSDGYSILGNFINLIKGQLQQVNDGLYLDCDIDGSRKHNRRYFCLFKIINGELSIIQDYVETPDYALRFRTLIQKELEEFRSDRKEKLNIEINAAIELLKNNGYTVTK